MNPPGPISLHSRRSGLSLTQQLALTLGFSLLVALALSALGGWDQLGTNLVYSLLIGLGCALAIDLCTWLADRLMRRLQLQERPSARLGLSLLAMALGVALGAGAGLNLADALLQQPNTPRLDLERAATVLVIALLASGLATAFIYLGGRLAEQRKLIEQERRVAAESRLRLLEAQLEPHMLFNTLANLRVLIALQPPQAQAMLDQLIDFLRGTLQASRQGSHSLRQEFERIQAYLGLMQIRMGERLQTELLLPEALFGLQIPPLLLQPLIENAIKHGLEPKGEGGLLRISAERQGATLCLQVLDTGLGLNALHGSQPGTGFGLTQVRERLAVHYGAQARLELQPWPAGGTLARLTLPIATPN